MRGSAAHGAGDLHRVDDEALAGQGLERVDVVAVVQPALDELDRRGDAALGALLGDDRHRGVDEPASPSSSTSRTQSTPSVPCERCRLGLVVEAQHRGRGAAPQDPPAGVEAGVEGREAEGGPPLGRRDAGGPGGAHR